MKTSGVCGAATVDITPSGSVFLYGYPHVPRKSEGVHDPLECAALYIRGEGGEALFLSCDLIYFARDYALGVRKRIAEATGVPLEGILLAATHTHSGPVTVNNLGSSDDPVIPRADPALLEWLAGRIVEAAEQAVGCAEPAEIGLARARAEGVGSNRHDPAGPADPEVPVFVVRSTETRKPIGCLLVYAMHPTVMHEDSRLISSDFPHYTRSYLKRMVLGQGCPVVYLQGAAGNQSPRHVTRANTFEEAQRIGENLGRAVASVIPGIEFGPIGRVQVRRELMEVEPRTFPSVAEAEAALKKSRDIFARLKSGGAPRQEVRTAECDVFGAEKTLIFARARESGKLAEAVRVASPAEIQSIRIGELQWIAWPGEFFVEHGLALKEKAPGTILVTIANGELQGYIATPAAVARGAYEATNAVFRIENGPRFVERSVRMVQGG